MNFSNSCGYFGDSVSSKSGHFCVPIGKMDGSLLNELTNLRRCYYGGLGDSSVGYLANIFKDVIFEHSIIRNFEVIGHFKAKGTRKGLVFIYISVASISSCGNFYTGVCDSYVFFSVSVISSDLSSFKGVLVIWIIGIGEQSGEKPVAISLPSSEIKVKIGVLGNLFSVKVIREEVAVLGCRSSTEVSTLRKLSCTFACVRN